MSAARVPLPKSGRPAWHVLHYRPLLLSVFLILYAGLMSLLPRTDIPVMPFYGGPTSFDQQRAFIDLETLANQYPSRVHGTAAYVAAAAWVAGRFEEMGLQPTIEEFEAACLPPAEKDLPDGAPNEEEEKPRPSRGLLALLMMPLTERQALGSGPNVTALVPGQTPEAIVVFAHLDSVWSPGADDNASGVAAVLELARVFSATPARATYAFVAFGGEEEGLWGSRAWVRQHIRPSGKGSVLVADGVSYGPVRVAIGLDCVAYAAGTLPQVYSLSFQGRKCDLGTLALLDAVLGSRVPGWRDGRGRFKVQALGGPGGMGSDHLAFLEAGVSAVCFGRATSAGQVSPYPNGPDDTLEHVSPDSLADAGRLAEGLLRTIDGYDPAFWATDQAYLIHPQGLTPGWMVTAAAALLVALAGAYGAPVLANRRGDRPLAPGSEGVRLGAPYRFRAELRWYGLVAVWSLLLAGILDLAYINGVPLLAVALPWFTVVVASLPVLSWLRLRGFWPAVENANDYLSLALGFWGVVGLLLMGPAKVIYFLFWPVVALSRLRGHTPELKALLRAIVVVWAAGWVLGGLSLWGSFNGTFGIRSALAEFFLRSWFLGLGFLVFPAIWQATAREYRRLVVLVPNRADARRVQAVLVQTPGLHWANRAYCSPDSAGVEMASSLGYPEPIVLEELREIGDLADPSKDDLRAILAEPDKTARGGETAAAALERVDAALVRLRSEVESLPHAVPGIALVIAPEGLATLRAVGGSAAARRRARDTGRPAWRAEEKLPLWAEVTWGREVRRRLGRASRTLLAVVDLEADLTLKEFVDRRPAPAAARPLSS